MQDTKDYRKDYRKEFEDKMKKLGLFELERFSRGSYIDQNTAWAWVGFCMALSLDHEDKTL